MGDSAWDKQLRELLGQFYSDRNTSSWDQLAKDLDSLEESTLAHDVQEDAGLRESLSDYRPEIQVEGWEKLSSALDAHDRAFDEKIKQKFHQYEPPYDPQSWPEFFQKFTDRRLLRTKLVILKSLEFAAILLFILTMVNIGWFDRFPQQPTNDDNPVENKQVVPPSQDKAFHQPGNQSPQDGIASASIQLTPGETVVSGESNNNNSARQHEHLLAA